MSKASKCKFCDSTKCKTRIVCASVLFYDEVACDHHIKDLERDADKTLGRDNGVMRMHIISSAQVKRGESWEKAFD